MTERLTEVWIETLEEAFGQSGKLGREAELFVMKAVRSWGWKVTDHQDDKILQIAGIDISIQKPTWKNAYSVDVKGNMNHAGTFYVDTDPDGWLYNRRKRSHRVWHANPTTGWMAWYDREQMRVYLKEKGLYNTGLVAIRASEYPEFVSMSKYG